MTKPTTQQKTREARTMYEGTLIAESLRVGTTLDEVPIVVRTITRHQPAGTSPEQPARWTNIDFEIEDTYAEQLADALARTLDSPGWYVDYRSATETYVVFPGQVFRYLRGDSAGRAEAEAYGRALGVPEHQLDWTI